MKPSTLAIVAQVTSAGRLLPLWICPAHLPLQKALLQVQRLQLQLPVSLTSMVAVSPSDSPSTSSTVSSPTPGIVYPLVSAGLVSPDLMDILAVPPADAAVSKRRTKRLLVLDV